MPLKRVCIHIETDQEVEIKRVKYILNKEGIEIPQGMMFFVTAVEDKIEELTNHLKAKTSPRRVHIYEVKETSLEYDAIDQKIDITTGDTRESMERFVQFLISKRKGLYQRTMGEVRQYRIYTKKGNVDMDVRIEDRREGGCRLVLGIHGYREAAQIIHDEFNRELEALIESGRRNQP